MLETAFRDVRLSRPLYPMVGIDSHARVSANFGHAPFALDLPHLQAQLIQQAVRLVRTRGRDQTPPLPLTFLLSLALSRSFPVRRRGRC